MVYAIKIEERNSRLEVVIEQSDPIKQKLDSTLKNENRIKDYFKLS